MHMYMYDAYLQVYLSDFARQASAEAMPQRDAGCFPGVFYAIWSLATSWKEN